MIEITVFNTKPTCYLAKFGCSVKAAHLQILEWFGRVVNFPKHKHTMQLIK